MAREYRSEKAIKNRRTQKHHKGISATGIRDKSPYKDPHGAAEYLERYRNPYISSYGIRCVSTGQATVEIWLPRWKGLLTLNA